MPVYVFYQKEIEHKLELMLVEFAHTQLWLVLVLECQPIGAQRRGCHIHCNFVHGFF